MIEFKNVDVTYPGGLKALKDVSITIEDGELVVIVGLSGAGKSTMLRAINGFVPITAGSVIVNGVHVEIAKPKELRAIRSEIGMIFQTFNLVKRTTVINNVLMGRLAYVSKWRSIFGAWPADEREKALQSLERVEIVERLHDELVAEHLGDLRPVRRNDRLGGSGAARDHRHVELAKRHLLRRRFRELVRDDDRRNDECRRDAVGNDGFCF